MKAQNQAFELSRLTNMARVVGYNSIMLSNKVLDSYAMTILWRRKSEPVFYARYLIMEPELKYEVGFIKITDEHTPELIPYTRVKRLSERTIDEYAAAMSADAMFVKYTESDCLKAVSFMCNPQSVINWSVENDLKCVTKKVKKSNGEVVPTIYFSV